MEEQLEQQFTNHTEEIPPAPVEEPVEEQNAEASSGSPAPPGPLKKIFNLIGNIAFAVLLLFMFVLVFSMVQSRITGGPPGLFGYQMYIVQGGSMSPAFDAGSLAFLRPAEPQNLAAGDIITYRPASGGNTLTTHRIMEVNREGGQLSFTTRGDANLVNDPLPVYAENVVGQVVYTVPYAGFVMNYGQTQMGIITLVFIPGALIIAFELRNLFRLAAQWEEEKARQKQAENTALTEEAPQ